MRFLASTCVVLAGVAACGGDDSPGAADGGQATIDAGAQGPWATAPEVIDGPIQETAVVALDGKIYVIGGFTGEGEIVADVRVFDTMTSTWSRGVPLPAPIHHANAVVIDNVILVLGGLGAGFTPIATNYSIRPGLDTAWKQNVPMPAGTGRGSAAIGVLDRRVILAGGLRQATSVDTVSAYIVDQDSWDESLPALPEPRDHGCGAVVNGTFLVIGGRGGGISAHIGSVLALNAAGTGWDTRAPMITARGGVGCGIVDDTVIVVGGEGNGAVASGVFAEAEAYDFSDDAWRALPPMPTPRHGMGAAAWGRTLYVPGGATVQAFGAVATHETFTLAP